MTPDEAAEEYIGGLTGDEIDVLVEAIKRSDLKDKGLSMRLTGYKDGEYPLSNFRNRDLRRIRHHLKACEQTTNSIGDLAERLNDAIRSIPDQ